MKQRNVWDWVFVVVFLAVVAAMVAFVNGCTVAKWAAYELSHPNWENQLEYTNSEPAAVTNANPLADEIDISNVRVIGKHKHDPRKCAVTVRLYNVDMTPQKKVLYNADPLPTGWQSVTGSNGKTTDGGVCILWRESDGTLTGGFFDHHGINQREKGLENVRNGYIAGQQPPDGAECWFYLVDYLAEKGNQAAKRSNVVKAKGTWRRQ
jgi:hypothetical protein